MGKIDLSLVLRLVTLLDNYLGTVQCIKYALLIDQDLMKLI